MTTITLDKAQQELPDLIKRALAGEDIVVEVGGQQVRLIPLSRTARSYRGRDALRGQLVVGDDFFEPLSDEECGIATKPGNGGVIAPS